MEKEADESLLRTQTFNVPRLFGEKPHCMSSTIIGSFGFAHVNYQSRSFTLTMLKLLALFGLGKPDLGLLTEPRMVG
jgi:hypothetical protein